MTRTPAEIMADLAPPIRLMNWLDKVFAAKRSKGEDIPPEFVRYMATWRAIRGDGPAITDSLSDAEWGEIDEATGQYVSA